MRRVLAALLALAATPGAAQEGGAIRTGEHNGFTRLVMAIDPATEWSLETGPGEATIFFPGREVAFGTAGAFERIPRTRVTAIASEITPAGTTVRVSVNCDCRISASFVGARHLALDVATRTDAAEAEEAEAVQAEAEATPEPEPEVADAAPEPVAPPAPEEQPALPASAPPLEGAEEPEAREAREAGAVVTAESILLQQLGRAADQGIVQLAPDQSLPKPAETAPPTATEMDGAGDLAAAAPETAGPAADPDGAPPAVETAAAADGPAPRPGPAEVLRTAEGESLPDSLAELMLTDQIEAMTVFDRDSAALAAALAARREAPPAPCLPDDALDVGRWTNGLSLHQQMPQLMRGVVGEFDRPDPRAVRDIARLYIRFGFGLEARGTLENFEAEFADRALLADLAAAVEGRAVAPDGPLALDLACPGRHGLWLALGGAAPAYHDPAHFETVQAAFADLPVDLRGQLGPTLIARLVDAGRIEEARILQITMTRPGLRSTVDLQFAEAKLLAAEGETLPAVAALRALAESNAPNAVEALTLLARIAVDKGLALPDQTLVDLRSAAVQQRGDAREVELRGLLIEALAARGDLPEAIAEARAARADLPESRAPFRKLAQTVLAAAEPQAVGEAEYAETILASGDLIAEGRGADAARAAIGERLIAVGLPNAALDILAPATAHGAPEGRLIAAQAHLALGAAQDAIAALDGLDGVAALQLRAAAYARSGAPEQALALLDQAGALVEGQPYAWPSGAWERVQAGEDDPERLAMAGFMAARSAEAGAAGAGPGAPAFAFAPEAAAEQTPEAAFQAPLPPLDTPSLGAARSLLATAGEMGGFLGGLLSSGSEAAAAP